MAQPHALGLVVTIQNHCAAIIFLALMAADSICMPIPAGPVVIMFSNRTILQFMQDSHVMLPVQIGLQQGERCQNGVQMNLISEMGGLSLDQVSLEPESRGIANF